MQDIVFRRRPSEPTPIPQEVSFSERPQVHITPVPSQPKSLSKRAVFYVASLFSPKQSFTVRTTARRQILEQPPEIVEKKASSYTFSQEEKPEVTAVEVIPTQPSVALNVVDTKSSKLRETAVTYSEKVKKTARHARTPLGKITIFQTALVLVLFGTVLLKNNHSAVLTTRNIGQSLASSTAVRRYLPEVSDASTAPQAFTENLASVPNTKLALYGWITPWNVTAQLATATSYSSISAFWATVGDNGIDVVPKSDWGTWQQYRKSSSATTAYLTISGDPDATYKTISDQTVQTEHIAQLLQTVQQQGFDGIDIDYEGLGSENRDQFTAFIQNLSDTFHASGKKVAVTVEARVNNDVPMDWKALGLAADEVRIMAYDYHGIQTPSPGPIAPIGWIREITEYALKNIPANKVIIGLGNYGYDWTAPANGQTNWSGTGISYDQAVATAAQANTPITRATGIDDNGYDVGSIPMYTYTDTSGISHVVWFEDQQSLQAKLALVSQYPVTGVIFWSVGLGDTNFWNNQKN